MADVKWIKITTDIFDDEKMYAIETQQDGQLMELIWFKLLCLAGKCNNHGFLMISNKIAYTDEMLAKIFRVEIGSVQRALTLFQDLEMVEVVENKYMIANWDKHQSSENLEKYKEQNRLRQQNYRDRQKKLALEDKKSNVTNNVTDDVINNVNCSYSISNSISNSKSNKTNKSNLIILKDIIDSYKYKCVFDNNTELQNCVIEWLNYKDERKDRYTPTGLTKLLTQFVNNDEKYGTTAVIECVDVAMSNNWAGIIWDRIKPAKNSQPQSQLEAIFNA